jgi:multidrug efflux system outer membrane protein
VASEYGRRAVQVALISEVARAYFVLLENDVKLQTAVRTQKSREESLNIIQERFNKGYTAEIDLNQSQIQEAIAAALIPLYKRNVVQAENALNVLLGRFPGTIPRGVTLYEQVIPPDIPAGLPSDLLLRRPDVQEVEKILIAQNARIGVAQALRFPSISLTGLLGAASPDLSGFSLAWTAGGGLLGPLFQFGKNKKRVEIERALYEQVLKEYELTVIQAFAEVENALIAVETLEDEFEARNRQVRAAENAKMLATERYNGGVTSYLEVLEQERQLFNAELEAATVRQLQLTAYVQLYKALGGGWITREEAAADQEAGE